MSESTSEETINRAPISSRRVVKPSAKKRRPALACVQCYQRKLKCGRELPSCSRCSKAGNADGCTYRSKKATSLSPNGLSTDEPSGSATVMAASLHTPISLAESRGRPETSSGRSGEMIHLKGQEAITKFYGCSYPLNFYQQFTELRSYIVQIKIKNPAINRFRDELYPLANDDYRLRLMTHDTVSIETLRQLIPTKSVADALFQTYIDRFEVMHRVLDIPTFIIDYNQHWITPLSSSAPFLAQFLLVAAAAASFHPNMCNEVVNQGTLYNCATDWIEAAESWLNSSTNQFSQSVDTLATHCLVLIAKRTHYIQEGSFWTYTGTLVRRAMAAGYHREASPTAKISLYYREMRRRLWMTIIELDIQASVDRGMTPNIRMEDFNIKSPLNIEDNKLQSLSQETLEGMPLATFTETSFQVHMYRSLSVRLEICALVNGCCDQDDFERVLRLEEELGEALRDIPEWDNPRCNPRQKQLTMYVKRSLSIYLHQYKLLLHIRFAIQGSPSSKSTICRRARLEAALMVLDNHQKLISETNVPEQACRTGLLLAAVNICHEIYMNFGPHALNHSPTMPMFPEVSAFLVANVEQALRIMGEKLTLTFHGLSEYYILSMMIGLVKSKLSPASCASYDQEAAERVTRICTMLQSRRAVIESDQSVTISEDNVVYPRPDSQADIISMAPEGATEMLDSMFPDAFEFINDISDYGFFHV
ncbi:hypothetical protein N7456_005118 [Penicillium angulare]|uniref:Zn(2)-C6 fungal-type domain-containing protein n=1 Tax=Penicillium angulare TaxID=116970 RepID=A0A9W9FXU9_9EURO|nr:hypothetical protein N7456_005118 [Penicillium angulare]